MNKIDLSLYFNSAFEEVDGIFSLKSNQETSFPQDGYDNCFQIEDDSFWFNHRNNCISTAVLNYSSSNTFFDIGGGNGKVSEHLERNGIEVVLIESGKRGVSNAKIRGISNLVCANLKDLDVKPSSIPSIGMFDVLEHIEDDESCLSKIFHGLQPGGCFYLTVPAYSFLWSKKDVEAGHFRRYTLKSLKKKLKQAGFDITYASYIFQYLPLPIFVKRVLLNRFLVKNRDKVRSLKKDHVSKTGKNWLLRFLNEREVKKVLCKKEMAFGGSILMVAHKKEPWR